MEHSDADILRFIVSLYKDYSLVYLPEGMTRKEIMKRLTEMVDQVCDAT